MPNFEKNHLNSNKTTGIWFIIRATYIGHFLVSLQIRNGLSAWFARKKTLLNERCTFGLISSQKSKWYNMTGDKKPKGLLYFKPKMSFLVQINLIRVSGKTTMLHMFVLMYVHVHRFNILFVTLDFSFKKLNPLCLHRHNMCCCYCAAFFLVFPHLFFSLFFLL